MPELGFCKLEVTAIHSPMNLKDVTARFQNMQAIQKYFVTTAQSTDSGYPSAVQANKDKVIQVKFDNTQLNCELQVIDSTEDESDTFTFTVYNVPDNTIFIKGDYLLFKWYWDNDPDNYTMYHGTIDTAKAELSAADRKIIVKGPLVNQDILYNYTSSTKYPKLTYYSDVKDYVVNDLKLDFKSTMSIFTQKQPMSSPILTKGKSVGKIMETVCERVTKGWLTQSERYPGDKCKYKFVNGQAIYFYRDSDLKNRNETILNKEYKIPTISIHYNDLFDFQNIDGVYTIEVTGLPTLKSGIAFYIDCANVPAWVSTQSAYYLADEVEHNFSLKDGYNCKIYARLSQ